MVPALRAARQAVISAPIRGPGWKAAPAAVSMNALITHYPVPSLLAALLFGMIVKWLLDLFFLRSRVFGLERQVTERERDLTDLRHDHNRALVDLKNRLTELDATQKAKILISASLAARETDLADARRRLTGIESEIQTQREAAEQWRNSFQAREAELALARERMATLDGELAAGTSVYEAVQAAVQARDTQLAEVISRETELSARLEAATATGAAAAQGWEEVRMALEAAERQVKAAAVERGGLEQELAALRVKSDAATKARAAAERELKKRELEFAARAPEPPNPDLAAQLTATEAELVRLSEGRASLEAELAAVSGSHARLEEQLAEARAEARRLEARLEDSPAPEGGTEKDTGFDALLSDLDQMTRERNDLAAEVATLRLTVAGGRPGAASPKRPAAETVDETSPVLPQRLGELMGLGPADEKRLHDAGIRSFEDLAAATVEDLARVCPGSGTKHPDYKSWIRQARALAEGWEG